MRRQHWTGIGGRRLAQPLGRGIWRLSESALLPEERSWFYLVEGTARTCLIDGGWGLGPAPQAALAIATHSHFDHIGHLGAVALRLGHVAEAAVFADPTPAATQALPFLLGRRVLPGGCLDMDSFAQGPCPLTETVTQGDSIDLGGRCLRVFHTPGHSPGSISLLDSRTGTLFSGDVLLQGHIYDDIPGADPQALADSHRRLLQLDFSCLCGGHGVPLDRPMAEARARAYSRQP